MSQFLYQPVKPWFINQKFGENLLCFRRLGNGTIEYKSKKTEEVCPIGYTSIYSQMKGHNGLDLLAARWQPVYASQDGFVEEVSTEVERGLGVGVITDKKYPCIETGRDEYFKYRNWHFIALNIHEGDHVRTGDLLGYADSTGYSSGDHLHFELKPVLKEGDKWFNILQNNFYFGAVNPEPYLYPQFAVAVRDIASLLLKIREQLALLADLLADLFRRKN